MNELLSDAKGIAVALLGIVVSLLGWLGKRLHERLDEHAKKHVTRDELDETIRLFREDRARMHQENRADLQYIRERIDTVADRR